MKDISTAMTMDKNIVDLARIGAIPGCPQTVKCKREIICAVAIGTQQMDFQTLL